MKIITVIYGHKTLEIFIWYIRLAGRTSISPGNAIFAFFFMGPHLALGAPNPYFPCYILFKYMSKRNKRYVSPSSSQQSVWIVLTILFFLESLAELFNKAPLVSLLMCFSFCCLFQGVLLISQSCFHRGIRQDCCSSFLSSVSSSFPACRFRKRKDKFRSQGCAWGRICFGRCSFERTWFGKKIV